MTESRESEPARTVLLRRRGTVRNLLIVGMVAVAAVGAAVVFGGNAGAATNCTGGYVGLTYDDGPNSSNTTTLLNALTSNGLRATMFNIGRNAQNNPALARAQRDAGMWVANHSFTHPHLITLSQAQIQSELQQTQTVLQQILGTAPRLFRPPYGETNATLRTVEQQLGLREIIWDVDSQDWNGATTAQIVQRASSLQSGQIILMHDQYATTVAAIPQIAANLRNRNVCAGMISPSTGRAVAPDGTTTPPPTTAPPTTPSGGSCTATITAGQQWPDRFNLSIAVTGTNNWIVTITLNSPQAIQNSWNATITWNGLVGTARPNGNGNTFGITVWRNGNSNLPTVSCRVG